MKTIEFTDEEIALLLRILNSVSIQGTEGMKQILALVAKLEKSK
jgi:hypothetical protein